MPLPELGLSLSITDNPGSPLYAGNGAREKMTEFDSAMQEHKIIITISDEIVSEVELDVQNDVFDKITLPTYKMMVTDDKTEEKTYYEVTRDTFLLQHLRSTMVGRFSFLGIDIFRKQVYTLPMISFEPLVDSIESFRAFRYRTRKEDHLSYSLKRVTEKAMLVSGKISKDFINKMDSQYFFYVVDHNEGQRFIGDISYREKFIKSLPQVEIQLIKRGQNVKEYELSKKGKINKIIYF